MTVYPLDIAVIVWGLVGTIVIKQQLRMLSRHECTCAVIVGTAIAFSLIPILIFRVRLFEYSEIAIVLSAVLIFWFALLAIRSARIK